MKFIKSIVLILSLSLTLSPFANAKRFGGGRSYGMQRNIQPSAMPKSTNYNQGPSNSFNNRAAQPQTTAPKSGIGTGTAAALGAAAGVAGGYMLGKSMSNNNTNAANTTESAAVSSTPVTNSTQEFPWGIIAILAMLLMIGLFLFKRKSLPNFNNNNFFSQSNPAPQMSARPSAMFNATEKASAAKNPLNDRMADGIEQVYFLRQVKGMFLHIQSMNNQENINEIAKYMTPELYAEIKDEIAQNPVIADFKDLNADLISNEVDEDKHLLASVKFSGMVSESPEKAPEPFSEIWHFIKADIETGKWLVAEYSKTQLQASQIVSNLI